MPVTSLSPRDLDALSRLGPDVTADDLRAVHRWRCESPEFAASRARADAWPWGTLLSRQRAQERIVAGRRWARRHAPEDDTDTPPPVRRIICTCGLDGGHGSADDLADELGLWAPDIVDALCEIPGGACPADWLRARLGTTTRITAAPGARP